MPPNAVTLRIKSPLFVGSYARIPVSIAKGSKLAFDDLVFEVKPNDGSLVSPSRDATWNPRRPHILLLAGWKASPHEVVVRRGVGGAVVGVARFEVTTVWKNHLLSPSQWLPGSQSLPTPQPTWGGGTSTGPENVPTTPQTGTRRLVIVFVDTTEARYATGTTLTTAQTRWLDNAVNGIVGSDGVTRSTAAFYREVSYFDATTGRGVDLTATVLPSVVSLTTNWAANFSLDANGNWRAISTFCNSVIAAGGVANFAGANMVVCVVNPVPAAGVTAAKIAWAYGGFSAVGSAGGASVNARGVVMSNSWGDGTTLDQGGGRTIYETLTHELGHTLNLGDAYTPVVTGRNVATTPTNTSWDPMDWEKPWPHFALAHRLMLGWIDPSWVRCYNFSALGTLVDEEIVLAPVEHGAPFPNAYLGIEIRVASGRNYYFEYRRGETNQIGDELLTPNARVVGMDVTAANATRPDILLLVKHADDDGAVLDVGQKYHEIDSTSPTFPVDFRLDVVSIAPDMARVRVRYSVTGKPDPQIRPWPADPQHPWQSPDILVSNPRSLANPTFTNVPWNGHPNTVTAQIKNGGTLSAAGVVARFYWKDYTLGGAPETLIGSDTQTIGPGATVPFSVTWTPVPPTDPAVEQHYCIIVRIDPYATPTTPPVNEMDAGNNEAQSNYAQFISATSSPPSRQVSRVAIGNPYKKATRFFLRPGQANAAYRTYLEHYCVTLKPKEVRQIEVMFEHAPDAHAPHDVNEERWAKMRREPNTVSIMGLIEDPRDPRLHGPTLLNGAEARVLQARATRFDGDLKADGEVVSGRVVTRDDGEGVSGGHVIFVVSHGRKRAYETVAVRKDGHAVGRALKGWTVIDAHYVPADGLGECTASVGASKKRPRPSAPEKRKALARPPAKKKAFPAKKATRPKVAAAKKRGPATKKAGATVKKKGAKPSARKPAKRKRTQ